MIGGWTAEEIARVRADTPGCARVAHFNNAGASLPPTPVLETHLAHLRREAEIGGYEAQEEAQARVEGVYASVARTTTGARTVPIGVSTAPLRSPTTGVPS